MKKLVLLLAAAFIGTQLFAQPNQRGKHGPSIEKLYQELSLTDAQMDEFKALRNEFHEKRKAMHDATERPTREERKAVRKANQEKMFAILTPEQVEKFDALKAERQAKRTTHFEENKAKFKEAKLEMKQYHENEVKPVLLAQRVKLEKQISRKDKKEIAKLRTLFTTYKKELKAERLLKKETRHTSKERENFKGRKVGKKRGHHGKGMKHFKEKYPDDATKLESLEQKYQATIVNLMEEIATERTAWKAKKEATKESFKKDHKKKNHNKADCKNKNGASTKECVKNKADHKAQNETQKRIGFLLMDPSGQSTEAIATPLSIDRIHSTNIYPNPATDEQTLTFNVSKSGNVLVEIIDNNGKVLQQVHNGNMNQGPQSINVDVTTLKGFVFYYRITDTAGTSATKFMTKR